MIIYIYILYFPDLLLSHYSCRDADHVDFSVVADLKDPLIAKVNYPVHCC